METDFAMYLALAAFGLVAGAINTLAGGGSNLTVPALMMMGLPADVANATNRVGIALQCVVGISSFDRHSVIDRPAVRPILVPTLLGGILGSLTAVILPNLYLKPLLLVSIFSISAVMLISPKIISPPAGTPTLLPTDSHCAWWGLLAAGFYGGLVQAGVGFMFIAVLAGVLRYDLLRANAMKLVCTLAVTVFALVAFIAFGKVWWIPGISLAVGTMLGAHLAVRFAIKASADIIRWIVFFMTIVAVIGGFLS